MLLRSSISAALVAAACFILDPANEAPPLRAALISQRQSITADLRELKRQGYNAIALEVVRYVEAKSASEQANRIRKAGFRLYYWIDVGRCEELASARPELMASIQGHPEWRRHFPSFPQPAVGEVVKNYPWAPVFYKEAFEEHLKRIHFLVRLLPKADGIFLNNLQAAPSACGCGNTLCRWTTDYGPIKTATQLGPDSAAKFVATVKKLIPGAEVIPVWTTECQEHEMAKGQACDGVPCFSGTCWYEYTRQLMPLAAESSRIGALLTYKSLGQKPEWVDSAIRSFEKMPPTRKGAAIPAKRILPILQGWKVSATERADQIRRSREAGSEGYVMSLTPIIQSWKPKLIKIPPVPSS